MQLTGQAAVDAFCDAHAVHSQNGLIGIAVSGGGDSMALLQMAHIAGQKSGQDIMAVTVDHGLRAEAAQEAETVGQFCKSRNISHTILNWENWSGQGNLQAAARNARYDLITNWANAHGVARVLLGHTADDQAETFLMRLARGSGVDGLAGMSPDSGLFHRPLLNTSRQELRDFLQDQNIDWVDDPSNDDTQFDRVKARQMRAQLETLGLTQTRILQTVSHMKKAKTALSMAAHDFAQNHVTQDFGDLIFDLPALRLHHSDTEPRVMAAAVQWISNADYRPRLEALQDAVATAQQGKARTLGGVLFSPQRDGTLRLSREFNAVAEEKIECNPISAQFAIWDGRWRISGVLASPDTQGIVHIAPLAEAVSQCPNWRDSGLPRKSLMASPAIWQGETLIAAPLAGLNPNWTAQIATDFNSFLLSH